MLAPKSTPSDHQSLKEMYERYIIYERFIVI